MYELPFNCEIGVINLALSWLDGSCIGISVKVSRLSSDRDVGSRTNVECNGYFTMLLLQWKRKQETTLADHGAWPICYSWEKLGNALIWNNALPPCLKLKLILRLWGLRREEVIARVFNFFDYLLYVNSLTVSRYFLQ